MVEPGRGVGPLGAGAGADGSQGAEDGLRDDGADFAGGGGEPVRGGAVAGGETFAGDDEGGGVGAWKLENVVSWVFLFFFLHFSSRSCPSDFHRQEADIKGEGRAYRS